MSITSLIALIQTVGPLIDKYWNVIQTIIKIVEALMTAFGIKPSQALSRAVAIQFRRATPEEEERSALKAAGLQPADDNHDFAYTTGG